jgi:AcrR family transcriptional regulator
MSTPDPETDRRILHGNKTRAALVRTARRLFRHGYEATGTPEIVQAAKVTRGALYHHFEDKRALFAAVAEDVAADIVTDINAAADARQSDPLAAVIAGCRAFLTATQNDERRQIFMVDAPSVLGWSAWRAIDARHGLGSLKAGLQACADAKLMKAADVDAVAHLISGALNEAAFALSDAGETAPIAKALDHQIERMVRSLVMGRS